MTAPGLIKEYFWIGVYLWPTSLVKELPGGLGLIKRIMPKKIEVAGALNLPRYLGIHEC
jgi:hypothetical protein